jgi:hypothetical protein
MATIGFDHNGFQNCANWHNTAKALKKAADKIRETYLVAYRNLDIGKSVSSAPGGVKIYVDMTKLDIDDLDQYPVAMLLMGYAIENIFRGIIITGMWLEDSKSVDMPNFADLQVPVKGSTDKMGIMKHHLRGLLAAKNMAIDFNDEEKDMRVSKNVSIVNYIYY